MRSPEIEADAARGSEILDESVVLADLSPGARASLDAPRLRIDEGEAFFRIHFALLQHAELPEPHGDHTSPPGAGSFRPSSPSSPTSRTTAYLRPRPERHQDLDEAPYSATSRRRRQASEQVKLIAVVTTAPDVDSTTVAVRCEEHDETSTMYWENSKLTAIEVKDEAQEN